MGHLAKVKSLPNTRPQLSFPIYTYTSSTNKPSRHPRTKSPLYRGYNGESCLHVLFPHDKLRNISTRMASCRNFSGEMDRTNISVVGKTLLCTMPFPFTRERRRRIAVSFQETFEELLESPSTSLLLHMQGNAFIHFLRS